jgi:hypothetical protein
MHLAAYLGAPALLVIVGTHLWGKLPGSAGVEPAAKARLEPGYPLIPRLRRQSIRFVCKKRDLRNLPAPRRRPKTSCDGLPQAKNRSRNSKLIAPATKQASRDSLSPPGWIRKAGANWKRLASSTADSGRSRCFVWRTRQTMRHPVLASSNTSMNPIREYPAGRAKAATCRPGAL